MGNLNKINKMTLKEPVTVNGVTYKGSVKVTDEVKSGIEAAIEKKKNAKKSKKAK